VECRGEEKMIVIDIETSGVSTGKNGIWQIGAINLENREEFLQEVRIDDEDEIMQEALEICGKTEEELRSREKQSQKQLIENFFDWLKKFNERIIAGHNLTWDLTFIQNKCLEYGISNRFIELLHNVRGIDLHTLAQLRYKDKKGNFKIKDGRSGMNLKAVLEFCGIKREKTKHKWENITRRQTTQRFRRLQVRSQMF
jgi:DNA polymerase III epsilon subunit-like protein